jgi:hypothetical protein
MKMWRLNYGNGQVLSCASRAEAIREFNALTQYKAFAYVQKYVGDGEWVRVK